MSPLMSPFKLLVRLSLTAALACVSTVLAHPAAPVAAAADSYRPLAPARILDTREGLGGPQARVGEDAAIELTVTDVGGLPASGVGAVVLNLTGTGPTQPTFIAAYPTGSAREGSSLNLEAGQTSSNLVIATVGDGGRVSLYNRFGSVDLIADVTGWFPAGDAYRPVSPARILDTREGAGPVGADASIDLTVTGNGGVPTAGVGAVVLNVTGTNPTAATFVAAYPAGGQRDGSNLNLLAGQTDSSLVIATVGDDGRVSLYNRFGSVDLIADVAGWFPAGSSYGALAPERILDTRQGAGPIAENTSIDIEVTGVGGVPSTGVGAVVLNLTATEPTAATFLSAYPTGGQREGSNLNLLPGQTTSNLVIATVGEGGRVSIYNRFGTTDVVADVAGWFPDTPAGSVAAGTLWGSGNGSIWRLDLAQPAGEWERRGDYDNAATVDTARGEWIAVEGLLDPLTIQTRALDTNVVTDEFVWETDAWDANDISASPDGRYLALVAESSVDTWIEIVDRETHAVVDLGWYGVAAEVEFAPNGDLLVVLDDSIEESYPWGALIAVITAEQVAAGSAPTIGGLVEFDDAAGVPGCIRVAHDGQISFSRNGALYVREPSGSLHQLTTSGTGDPHSCGVFSPDAQQIGFVQTSIAPQYQRHYVIPNHRDDPIYIDGIQGAGDEYVVAVASLVGGLITWLP